MRRTISGTRGIPPLNRLLLVYAHYSRALKTEASHQTALIERERINAAMQRVCRKTAGHPFIYNDHPGSVWDFGAIPKRFYSSDRPSACDLLRVAFQQMLADAFRVPGNYMTVFIEANHDDPIEDIFRPLTAWH